MKSISAVISSGSSPSRPARGAWIEIKDGQTIKKGGKSRPARGAWIEMVLPCRFLATVTSRPARGAWIEISSFGLSNTEARVAPRKGRVD